MLLTMSCSPLTMLQRYWAIQTPHLSGLESEDAKSNQVAIFQTCKNGGRPSARRMTSRAEAMDYISGETLECLECGKKYVCLDKHLRTRHHMTNDEYREKYNIPVSIPLAGAGYREKHRQKMQGLQESGSIDYTHLERATD
ncbi:MucR family transcriptional regulator, partial [Salmonella enterica subsp. enterica]|nr:MucR family transcriptional regulator [Salmonella enterica subsp. enterica]